jgi:hypothetical protein
MPFFQGLFASDAAAGLLMYCWTPSQHNGKPEEQEFRPRRLVQYSLIQPSPRNN